MPDPSDDPRFSDAGLLGRPASVVATADPERIEAPVSNYCGTPYVERRGEEYVIGLGDCDGLDEKPVSRAFFEAWVREFGEGA